MPRPRIVTAILCAAALLCSAGCGAVIVGGAAAAGTYVYVKGEARGTYDATLDNAYAAALSTCSDLSIAVTGEQKDKNGAAVQGRYYGDTVAIDLQPVGAGLTEITVRVGFWGNESASRRIMGEIGKRL